MRWRFLSTIGIALASVSCSNSSVHSVATPIDSRESRLDDGVHVVERTVTYKLEGDGLSEVRAAMRRIGPLDGGRHQFGFTHVELGWSYPFERADGGCRTGPIHVEVEVTQTMPEWTATAATSGAASREWSRFMHALHVHEDGHRAIGLDTARQILAQQRELGTYPSCDALDAAANTVGDAALEAMRGRHREYDRTTRHGEDVGALLRQ